MIAKNKYNLFRLRTLLVLLVFLTGFTLQAQDQAAHVVSSGGGYSSGGAYTNFSVLGGGVVKEHSIGGNFDKSIGFLYNSSMLREIPEYNLFAESFPENAGLIVGAGIYTEGDSIGVSATANDGFSFIGWGAPAGNFIDVNVPSTFYFMPGEEVVMTAYFAVDGDSTGTSAIATGTYPAAAGEVSGSGDYLNGTNLTLIAQAAEGYRFVSWTEGDVIVSTNPEYTFEVGENRDLLANYALEFYTISLASSPSNNIGGSVLGGGTFPYGTEITINAYENFGFTFDGWKDKGVVSDTNATYTFIVKEDRNLTGLFGGTQYDISTAVGPEQSNGSVTGGGDYYYGDIVNLDAMEAEGYYFLRWMDGDDQVSVRNPYLFSALEDRHLVAEFGQKWWDDKDSTGTKNEWLITSSTTPEAVGIVLGQGYHADGTELTLTASPNEGINFVKWMMDGVDVTDGLGELVGMDYTFTASADMQLVAVFDGVTYSVQASADPVEAGNVAVSNNGEFFPGDLAVVSAEENAGYVFRNWTLGAGGAQLSVNAEYRFSVMEDRNVVAHYEALPKYKLEIDVVPAGAATVSGAGDYTVGTDASIGVVPAEGYSFRYWSKETELLSRATDTMLTMDNNLAITAFLEINSYSVNYTAGSGGSVSGVLDQMVDWGTNADAVAAVADACFEFVQWSDGSSENPRTDMSVKSELSLTAEFAERQVDVSVTVDGEMLTANNENATYQWLDCNNGNAAISGATSKSFTPEVSGNYALMVMDDNCELVGECIAVTVTGGTGFGDKLSNQFGFEVYPNPARDRFIVATEVEASFVVVNGLGQQVKTFELNSLNGYSLHVDGLSSGVYMIVGQLGEQIVTKRVIVTE